MALLLRQTQEQCRRFEQAQLQQEKLYVYLSLFEQPLSEKIQ